MLRLQNFAPRVVAEIVRRQPASAARTSFAWQLAVGPALARATIVDLHEGVLTVGVRDQRWGREIARARSTILERMQQLLGAEAVNQIVLMQE